MHKELTCISENNIPAMKDQDIEKVYKLEEYLKAFPTTEIPTEHVFHAGMYARSILVPANTVCCGALIKIATILIVSGDSIVFIGDRAVEVKGYRVFPASTHRKQALVALSDTYATMIFTTSCKTVEDAEKEFTDEYMNLLSRTENSNNKIIITGE